MLMVFLLRSGLLQMFAWRHLYIQHMLLYNIAQLSFLDRCIIAKRSASLSFTLHIRINCKVFFLHTHHVIFAHFPIPKKRISHV